MLIIKYTDHFFQLDAHFRPSVHHQFVAISNYATHGALDHIYIPSHFYNKYGLIHMCQNSN